MQTEHISIPRTGEFSLATGTSELGSYYHPHFTDSETESLSDFPTITSSSICSKAVLETFHTLCSVSGYSCPFSSPCPHLVIHRLCIHPAWFLSSVPSILFLVAIPCQMSLSSHCLRQILGLDHFPAIPYPHCFQPSESKTKEETVGTESPISCSGAHLGLLPPLSSSLHLFALLPLWIASFSRLQEICNETE